MSDDRTPYATRPLVTLYRVVGQLVATDHYLVWSEKTFVAHGMNLAGGKANPKALAEVYQQLMREVGLDPVNDEAV